MKIFKTISVIILLVSLTGCNFGRTKEEKLSAIINGVESPYLIATFSPQTLIEKSGIENGILPFTDETFFKFLSNEMVTGLSNTEQMQVVIGKGAMLQPSIYAFFNISSESRFQSVLKSELNLDVVEKDGYKTVTNITNNYVLVWNDEFAVFSTIILDFSTLFGGESNAGKAIKKCITMLDKADKGDVNEEYANFLAKKADLATFVSTNHLADVLTSANLATEKDALALQSKLKGNYFTSFLNFDKGIVKWEHDLDWNDDFLKGLKFIPEEGISQKLFKFGRSANPLLKYGFKVNPDLFVKFIEDESDANDVDFISKNLMVLGFKNNEMIESFTGEVLLIVDAVEKVTVAKNIAGYSYNSKQTKSIIGMAIGVDDEKLFTEHTKGMTKSANGIFSLDHGFFGYLSNDVFFVSNDSLWVNQVLIKKVVDLSDEDGTLKKHPYGFFAGLDDAKHSQFLKQNFIFGQALENISGFATLNEAEINFVLKDKSKNSLQVLTEFVLANIEKQKNSLTESILEKLEQETIESVSETFGEIEVSVDDIKQGINNIDNALKDAKLDKVVDKALDDFMKELKK